MVSQNGSVRSCQRRLAAQIFEVAGRHTEPRYFWSCISIIDPEEFSECFVKWTHALHVATEGEVIALDGKTIRHSFDTATGKNALHLVSAWASDNGLALGHVKVDSRAIEIKAIPKLLEMIDVAGCIVTTDAMGCQRDIAGKIIERQGDYVFCLKGNQGNLHEEVKYFFDEAMAADFEDVEHSYSSPSKKTTVESKHDAVGS